MAEQASLLWTFRQCPQFLETDQILPCALSKHVGWPQQAPPLRIAAEARGRLFINSLPGLPTILPSYPLSMQMGISALQNHILSVAMPQQEA